MKKRILFLALLAFGANAFSQTAKTIPYAIDFEEAATFTADGWTTENTNDDGADYTWWIADATYDMCEGATPDGIAIMYSNLSGDNDWLFSAPLSLETGTTYYLDFKYGTYELSSSIPTSLEVSIGTGNTSADMTTLIVKHEDYNNGSCNDSASASSFTVPSTGIYYIGFRAYGNAGQIAQFVDDFSVALTPAAAIHEREAIAKLSIYPNPAKSNVTVNTADGSTINLYNAMGELVYSKANANGNENIDVTGLVNGMYFIHVIQNNTVISKQIEVLN